MHHLFAQNSGDGPKLKVVTMGSWAGIPDF
jgi:hypothetical protein